MFYSNFYKEWIATCMRCKLALINFETSADHKVTNAFEQKYYDYKVLKTYFIIDHDMYKVRSDCGLCINKSCRAYMKNQ